MIIGEWKFGARSFTLSSYNVLLVLLALVCIAQLNQCEGI